MHEFVNFFHIAVGNNHCFSFSSFCTIIMSTDIVVVYFAKEFLPYEIFIKLYY